jgi:hypothetical protein
MNRCTSSLDDIIIQAVYFIFYLNTQQILTETHTTYENITCKELIPLIKFQIFIQELCNAFDSHGILLSACFKDCSDC